MNFDDIVQMHRHYDLDRPDKPTQLPEDEFLYRQKFIQEELNELVVAWAEGDMEDQADALIDIAVVAMGMAYRMGLDWEPHWQEVLAANMRKERATGDNDPRSTRFSGLDIVKPEGWVGPEHGPILEGTKWDD